jgi:hypothetical protein
MANGVLVQLAMVLLSVGIVVCALVVVNKRRTRPGKGVPAGRPPVVEVTHTVQPVHTTPVQAEQSMPQTITLQTSTPTPLPAEPATSIARSAAANTKVIVDGGWAIATPEDDRDRILAGISDNIRKTLETRQVAQSAPIRYAESKRSTEYVRVKKEIITPHGQIRFSILKDWLSTNMLAVFRRACLDWKTPEDLIAFLPAYLEAEAEIFNSQLLLIGTSGHNEKLAIPIRGLADESLLHQCFEFVTGISDAANTPAVVVTSDGDFEVVSKGVIRQPVFTNGIEKAAWEVNLVAARSPELAQTNYVAALHS